MSESSKFERWAAELRANLKDSGAFERRTRVWELVNVLESGARSYETEVRQLREQVKTLSMALEMACWDGFGRPADYTQSAAKVISEGA